MEENEKSDNIDKKSLTDEKSYNTCLLSPFTCMISGPTSSGILQCLI